MKNFFIRKIQRIALFKPWVSFPGGIRLWVTLVSFTFILLSITNNSDKLVQVSLNQLALKWLAIGILFSILSMWINAYAWQTLIFWLGNKPIRTSYITLYLRTNLFKYLPGGIWHFVARIRELNISLGSKNALTAVFLEPILMSIAALIFVSLGGWQSGISFICFIPCLLLLPKLREPLLRKIENIKFKQIKKADPNINLSKPCLLDPVSSKYPWTPLFVEMLFFAFRFGGFWCCLNAFSLGSTIPIGSWCSAFALAWTVGLVVPGAPGGVGVFESIFLIRLTEFPFIPKASLLAVLLCYRVVAIISDVMAPVFLPINRSFEKRFFKRNTKP